MPRSKKNADKKEITKATKWFLVRFGIEDWFINLYTTDGPPLAWDAIDEDDTWVGGCKANRRFKTAKIWVSPARNKKYGNPVLQTLFHELMHVVAKDIGIKNDSDDEREYQWDHMALALYDLYPR